MSFLNTGDRLGDTKYQHAIDRIDRVIESAMSGSPTLLWHRKCYPDFTHEGKVERLQKSLKQTSCSSSVNHFGEKQLASRRTSGVCKNRRTMPNMIWTLCLFCQEEKSKYIVNISNILQC